MNVTAATPFGNNAAPIERKSSFVISGPVWEAMDCVTMKSKLPKPETSN